MHTSRRHAPFFPSASDSAMDSVSAARTLSAMTLVTPAFFTTWSSSSPFFSCAVSGWGWVGECGISIGWVSRGWPLIEEATGEGGGRGCPLTSGRTHRVGRLGLHDDEAAAAALGGCGEQERRGAAGPEGDEEGDEGEARHGGCGCYLSSCSLKRRRGGVVGRLREAGAVLRSGLCVGCIGVGRFDRNETDACQSGSGQALTVTQTNKTASKSK